eukprot:NODE_195_length_15388_cov_0.563926.p8 type:complete len:111 gc:universal NODE_195_length_15388_cov_0.563926:14956-15288(+)
MSCYLRYAPSENDLRYCMRNVDKTNTQIKEEEERYALFMDLPGYLKENINIEIVQDELHVKAKKNEDEVEKTFRLPKDVDKERVSARSQNGVLEITLNKHPKFVKQIAIE